MRKYQKSNPFILQKFKFELFFEQSALKQYQFKDLIINRLFQPNRLKIKHQPPCYAYLKLAFSVIDTQEECNFRQSFWKKNIASVLISGTSLYGLL